MMLLVILRNDNEKSGLTFSKCRVTVRNEWESYKWWEGVTADKHSQAEIPRMYRRSSHLHLYILDVDLICSRNRKHNLELYKKLIQKWYQLTNVPLRGVSPGSPFSCRVPAQNDKGPKSRRRCRRCWSAGKAPVSRPILVYLDKECAAKSWNDTV